METTKIYFRLSLIHGENCTAFEFTNYHALISFIKEVYEHVEDPQSCSFVVNYLRKEVEVDG